MTTALEASHAARQRLIFVIAVIIGGCCAVLLLPTIVALVLFPGPSSWAYLAMLVVSLCGAGATLYLLRTDNTAYAPLPLAATIVVNEIVVTVLFPGIATFAAPFLTAVVLLVSIGNHRQLTIVVGVICTLLAMVMAAVTPLPVATDYGFGIGDLLVPVRVAATGSLVVLIWLVSDRLFQAHNSAMALANERARMAEQAQQETEQSRHELEQQNAEQQRLLELVTALETPILEFGESMFVAPIIGSLDSRRANALMEQLLHTAHSMRAKHVILDIRGVPVIDTAVAKVLLDMAQALRLLGTGVSISGVTASTALTLTQQGVDLETLPSVRNPSEALAQINRLGLSGSL